MSQPSTDQSDQYLVAAGGYVRNLETCLKQITYEVRNYNKFLDDSSKEHFRDQTEKYLLRKEITKLKEELAETKAKLADADVKVKELQTKVDDWWGLQTDACMSQTQVLAGILKSSLEAHSSRGGLRAPGGRCPARFESDGLDNMNLGQRYI